MKGVIIVKTEKIIGLRNCPMCGAPAVLRKNASKRFQVHCRKCQCCTTWTNKTEAVVKWYNNAKIYEDTHGITPPAPVETTEEKIIKASESLAGFAENLKQGGLIDGKELEAIARQILTAIK